MGLFGISRQEITARFKQEVQERENLLSLQEKWKKEGVAEVSVTEIHKIAEQAVVAPHLHEVALETLRVAFHAKETEEGKTTVAQVVWDVAQGAFSALHPDYRVRGQRLCGVIAEKHSKSLSPKRIKKISEIAIFDSEDDVRKLAFLNLQSLSEPSKAEVVRDWSSHATVLWKGMVPDGYKRAQEVYGMIIRLCPSAVTDDMVVRIMGAAQQTTNKGARLTALRNIESLRARGWKGHVSLPTRPHHTDNNAFRRLVGAIFGTQQPSR